MALRVSCALLLSAVLTRADAQHVATRGPGISATADFRAAGTVAAAARPAPQCSLAAGSGLLRPGARYTVDLTSGGKARTFLLRLPDDETTSAMPVLLAVHGALQSATIFLDVKDGAPPEVNIDSKAAAKGFVTIAPNALCDTPLQISTCRWAETATKLDPGWAADQQFPQQSEMGFFADAIACVKTVLGVGLSGDVFALGFSQGAKLVTRFGCAGADISGGELRLRGVVAAEGFFADELAYPTCGAAAGVDVTPPPMLLFQAQQDATVPYCTPSAPYIQSAEYFNRWAAGYAGCRQTVPFGQQVLVNSPAILQALCPQGSESLVTELANASVDVTRLQRVYTNGVGCTAPLALFWTSEAGSATGHAWPSPMAALGGMDGTDVALAFFARLQGLTALQLSSSDAFQPFLAQMSTCRTVVPAGLPPFLGLSAGPCSDLQGAASNAWLS